MSPSPEIDHAIRYHVPQGEKKMALFGSVSSKEVDAFAKELAEELAKRYPPANEQATGRSASQKRLSSILEEICNKALAFKNEHKLGVYKKARLGNTFRWELEERGYSKMFIETATEGLVVYLARKN
jgi:hypothetical protein